MQFNSRRKKESHEWSSIRNYKIVKTANKTPETAQIKIYSKDPNQNQGHNQEEDSNDEEKKDKNDMHGIQNVEDQNESTK